MSSTVIAAVVLGVVLALFGGGYYFGNQRGTEKYQAQQAQQAAALARAYEQQTIANTAKDARYEQEIAQLRHADVTYPVVPVRLCPSTPSARLPDITASANRPAAAGNVPPSPIAMPDIGPFLFAEADRADAIVAACRRTQSLKDTP